MKFKVSLGFKFTIYLILCILSHLFFSTIYQGLFLISIFEILEQVNKNHFISTFTFWNIGFIIIICLDGILSKGIIIEKTSSYIYNKTSILFLSSHLIIIYFYRLKERHNLTKYSNNIIIHINDYIKPIMLILVVTLYVFFLYSEFPNAFESLLRSRFEIIKESEFGGLEGKNRPLITSFIYYISGFSGYILPSLFFIAFNKKFSPFLSFIFAIIPSSIIWLIYIIIGTRHHILFSFFCLVGTYSLISRKKIKFRTVYLILIISGYFLSNMILDVRRHGFINYITGNKIERYLKHTSDINTDKTVNYMSYVVDYYDREENSYRYGQSTLTVIFFWVPRTIWKDKPPQFAYWFIREYQGGEKGFSSKYSAPSSYLAEIYSDFGNLGVIFISLLIGYLSFRIDLYFYKSKVIESYKQILFVSFFLASFFFLARQLNQFFSKLLIVYIIIYILFFFNKRLTYIQQSKDISNE